MNTLRVLAVAMVVCLVAGNARADDELSKMLVGKWVVTKTEEGAPPVGTTAEFTKDGKLTVTMKQDDKEVKMEGTYKCEAKKFVCTFKEGDKEKTMSHDVTKISEKEMTFTFEGKTVVCKKKS